MKDQETLLRFIPRHIRKLYQEKQQNPSRFVQEKEGQLNLSSTESRFGTVGTDASFFLAPDKQATKLKKELSAYEKMSSDQIVLANGTMEMMDLIARCCCNPHQDNVLTLQGSNTQLQHQLKMQAIEVQSIPLEVDLELPIYSIKRAINEQTKILFIENPHPITGRCFSNFDIVDLTTSFDGLVVINESAIDYATHKSLLPMVEMCSNVIIIHSFSRAWGLAGLPLAVAYSQAPLAQFLTCMQDAISINTMTQTMATKALYVSEQKERIVEKTINEREQLKTALEQLPQVLKVHESHSNTLLIESRNHAALVNYLAEEEQIIVQDVSAIEGFENCLRITVGPGINNLRFIKAMKDMPKHTSAGYIFWKNVGKTLKKASVYLGVFRKIFGAGSS